MRYRIGKTSFLPGHCAVAILASALVVPAVAQQTPSDSQNPPAAMTAQPSSTPPAAPAANANTDKEGFWGHVNPFARKKWVKKRLDPINDRLTELDQVNAKNASDIKDVDARAQAGIQKAQTTADAANQTATAAGTQAQNANTVAQGASGHVDQLNTTVNGLDQYKQINDLNVAFRGGSSLLSKDAKGQLDTLAQNLAGHQGYIVEIEARAPGAGTTGIQTSQKLAESVERYLVTEHQIPVYRMHYVALGNAPVETASADSNSKPERVRRSSVHIRLMENSLAAQDSASPHAAVSN
ncbi:MAG TPA: OmpA family protein [Terracidiphilus sp.]|jgi:outer membrane protein OmpA-like peptidoglycan-associated protein|nr:OmpA family protein [Terracidiphilus sp.]